MMSSTNEEDPFLQVQQDVLAQLQQTRPIFSSYVRIRSLQTSASSSQPSSNPELTSARSDLESALSSLTEDLEDLRAAVQAVESNPSQYGLSQSEVTRRQRLVQEIGGEVEDMNEELSKSGRGRGGSRNAAAQAARAAASGDLPDPNAFALEGDGNDDDDYAAEFEQQQQMQMMRDQDDMLDQTLMTVGNIRRQADDMGRELEEQREMLEVVDTMADRVQGRLQTGMAKMAYVVQKNEDRWSGCCIAVLIMVLIILLVLLLIL
ncbi:t-SNARE [Truncatella angustata]|uniref:t-SNARE n=1 Tax=Truncatella angustata TaxID=152316 RepID=A0A9P8UNF3_9PEZI|nr:t-SNARE [Truncatella angustata]KAH6655114.1 t-SNARE [Truncatella angustata]